MTSSVSAQTIEDSGDQEAINKLQQARRLVDEAKSDLSRNAVVAADDKLDRALAMVNEQARRLSGDKVKAEHAKDVYERRLKSVSTFLEAYKRVAENGSSRAAAEQANSIQALIDKAKRAASGGDYESANARLDDAYTIARGDIREIRQGQTLTRSLDFATAEEEYDYELGRNESHFLLLQFAFTERKPAGSVVGRIEENRRKAEALKSSAQAAARSGDHAKAIGELNQSTDLLLKAIRMSGMFVPG